MKSKILLLVSGLLVLVALYMVFIFAPTDAEMGNIQRIFYFHVPLAWIAFLAFAVVFGGSILYLWKRDRRWDIVASASAEVGLTFTTLFLITGSIWAKPIWGVWWTWDARLTSSLVLWLIYLTYFMVRSYITEDQRRARLAAVVGIIGFIDVPIVVVSIYLWRTMHPRIEGMDPRMLATLMVCLTTFTVLYLLLLAVGIHLKEDEYEVKRLKELLRG